MVIFNSLIDMLEKEKQREATRKKKCEGVVDEGTKLVKRKVQKMSSNKTENV